MLGKRWRKRITRSRTPVTIAACTKSCSLRAIASALAIRIEPGSWARPRAMITFCSEGLKMAANPTAMSRNGKARTTSAMRMATMSAAPR